MEPTKQFKAHRHLSRIQRGSLMALEGCGHNRQGWQSRQAQEATNHNAFLEMGMANRQEHTQTMIFMKNHGGITG
jgi:hypothetical protein